MAENALWHVTSSRVTPAGGGEGRIPIVEPERWILKAPYVVTARGDEWSPPCLSAGGGLFPSHIRSLWDMWDATSAAGTPSSRQSPAVDFAEVGASANDGRRSHARGICVLAHGGPSFRGSGRRCSMYFSSWRKGTGDASRRIFMWGPAASPHFDLNLNPQFCLLHALHTSEL